jgi:apolipoprotein N-acyltransferase
MNRPMTAGPKWKRLTLSAPRSILGLLLAAGSAVLLTLAFPPSNLGLLIWIGFVPMSVAQHRLLPGRISSLAPAIAISGWLGALLVPAFGGMSWLMTALPLGIFALVLATDRRKRAFHEGTAYRWFVLEGVVSWVGLEMIRGFVPAIGTWAFVGYALWDQPWLIQPLSVLGIYGLDLLIMLCNYALAQSIFFLIDRHRHQDDVPAIQTGSTPRWLITTGLLLGGWVGYSLVLYHARPPTVATVRVSAVQPDLPRAAHRDSETPPEERLAVLAGGTRKASAQGAQLVVWPEMGLGFDPQTRYTEELRSLVAQTDTYLVIGYVVDDPSGFRNEATVLSPSGEFLGIYGKTHPMVASGEPKTVSAGLYPIYTTSLGRLATMICFDASFTDVARQLGRQGVQLIANPSLFGPSIAAMPHTMAVFRAIENRSAMVMADVAYNSAVVDPHGRVLASSISREGQELILTAEVPLYGGTTVYSRTGDWLGWLSLVGWLISILLISLPRNKRPQHPPRY